MAMPNISELMVKTARSLNSQFSLNGRPLTMEEVFAPQGLLPGMARRADQLCSLCLGYGIGITFEEAEESALGVKVNFDDNTPNALRLLCLVDVLIELIRCVPPGETVPLDQLMYD
jgi:intracellular multiplication protein IcmS